MAPPKIKSEDLKSLAIALWVRAQKIKTRRRDVRNNWVLTAQQKKKLPRNKLLNAIAAVNSKRETPHARNAHLRRGFAKELKAGRTTNYMKLRMFDWIVRDWGGIQSHNKSEFYEKLEIWRGILRDFNEQNVQNLLADRGIYNISSWSKVLAFADFNKYAVYDARVAVSLNVLLHDLGTNYVFYMPPSQNRSLHGAIEVLRCFAKEKQRGKRDKYMRYNPYLELLHAIVAHTDAKDILEVELHLFSIGPKLGRVFWRCNKEALDEGAVRAVEAIIAKNIEEDE